MGAVANEPVFFDGETRLPGGPGESAEDVTWRFLTGPRADLTLEPPPPDPPAYWRGLQQELDAYLEASGEAPLDATGEAAPFEPGAEEDDEAGAGLAPGLIRSFLQSLMALCLVLGLFLLLSYGLRRFGQRSALIPRSELASLMGRVYLTPKVSIHFVRVGGKVLLIGVGQNEPRLLSEFPASAFDSSGKGESKAEEEARASVAAQRPDQEFWNELQERTRELTREENDAGADPEIASLRDDIKRLQRALQDSDREPRQP